MSERFFYQMKLQSGKFAIKGRIAYVSQEPWIINGTARENILFGKVKDEERFVKSVRVTCTLVRAFAHGAMGRRIDPSWGEPIELFLVPASVPRLVHQRLWDGAYKRTLAANRKE